PDDFIKPVAQSDFVGVVADATAHDLIARTELVAVAQPYPTEVELRHPRHTAVAAHVEAHTEYPLHEEHCRGLRLRTQALRIRHQYARTELEVRTQIEQRTRREVIQVGEFVPVVAAAHTEVAQHQSR